MLPGFELVAGYLEFRVHLHDLLWIGAELGEAVTWLIVLILAPKPLLVDHFLHVRDGLALLPVIAGQSEDRGPRMANDHALRRLFAGRAVIKGAPVGGLERE